ncbi:MAG: CPBP family intramembrane glutamic endopeptidase [Marmoricola sp.]
MRDAPDYRWWRPAIGIVAVPLAMFVMVPVVLLPVLGLTVALDHHGSFSAAYSAAAKLDPVTWQAMLYLNLTLAALVLVAWWIVRFVHGVRPRWLTSVAPGVRWKFFWACFGIALVAIGAQLLVGSLLPSNPDDLGGPAHHVDGRLVGLALVVLLSTPLQAMGEEYVFRGYLTQAFGALTRNPWFAILISSLLFALAHGVQNAPLFLDRFTFGVMAGYVVLRTGGLEAGIALHVWNNLVAFGLALAFGSIDDSLKVSSVAWSNIILTATQNGVYLVLVLLVARRMGLEPRRTVPVLPPAAAPV